MLYLSPRAISGPLENIEAKQIEIAIAQSDEIERLRREVEELRLRYV